MSNRRHRSPVSRTPSGSWRSSSSGEVVEGEWREVEGSPEPRSADPIGPVARLNGRRMSLESKGRKCVTCGAAAQGFVHLFNGAVSTPLCRRCAALGQMVLKMFGGG